MQKPIEVSVIYVYYNAPRECISSLTSLIKSLKGVTFEVIIIDNASPRPLPELSHIWKDCHIIINKTNRGYGAAMNQGAKVAKGTYLLISNADVDYEKDTIKSMLNKMNTDSSIGIIGPQILDKDRTIITTSSEILTPLKALIVFSFLSKLFPQNRIYRKYFLADLDRKIEKDVPSISGACMLVKTSLFTQLGGFDTRFFMYFEEIDLCLRIARLGLRVVYYPRAKIIHTFGTSTGDKALIQKRFEQSRYLFLAKYYGKGIALLIEAVVRLMSTSPHVV